VTGIIPKFLTALETPLEGVNERILTEDMHQRKQIMFNRADAFVVMPGGIGTLEEAFEMLTWRQLHRHRKPIVFDEIKYEGDIPLRWGNLSAEEMVHRFWECIIAGTYPGHGECLLDPFNVLWWSKEVRWPEPARIAFLRDIWPPPAEGIQPIDKWQLNAGKPGSITWHFGEIAREVEVPATADQSRQSAKAGRRHLSWTPGT
jgi:hypothetical protein